MLDGKRPSKTALNIVNQATVEEVLGRVKQADIVRELESFNHNASKIFQQLGCEYSTGVYCGGERLLLASVRIS